MAGNIQKRLSNLLTTTILIVSVSATTSCKLDDNQIYGQLGSGSESPAQSPPSPGPPVFSLSNSTFSVERNWTSLGIGNTITISTKDQYGELFYDSLFAPTLTYSGGSSTGWFGTTTDNGDGTYTAEFFGNNTGTPTSISVDLNGETISSPANQVEVRARRLAFTGNSDPTLNVTNRVFDEVDNGFTVTGNCDVELGNVTLTGDMPQHSIPCVATGGGTFSVFVNYMSPTLPYFSDTNVPKNNVIQASQGNNNKISSNFIRTNSSSPPTLITNRAQLNAITCGDSTVSYILNNDIDIAAEAGSGTNNHTPLCNITAFSGVFDGNNFSIANIHNGAASSFAGLFGRSTNASIINLTIANITMSGTGSVGGIVGSANSSNLFNLHITGGNITGTSFRTGGIVGDANGGFRAVDNTSFSGVVSSSSAFVGGICGDCSVNVQNSSSSGSVIGTLYVGGIVGSGSSVYNCNSSSDVTGTDDAGGISGYLSGWIANSYSSGNISGTNNVGGIVGRIFWYPTGNYFTGSLNVSGTSGGAIWGVMTSTPSSSIHNYYLDSMVCSGCDVDMSSWARSDTQLKTRSTFENWNFQDFYRIDEGVSYPIHQ